MNLLRLIYALHLRLKRTIDRLSTFLQLYANSVKYETFRTSGVPYISISRRCGNMTVGKNWCMNNGIEGNPIGCYERCTFYVNDRVTLQIGDNFGISQSAIICYSNVSIGNNVKIGGGCKIITSDFHSLDPKTRASKLDLENRVNAPVTIGNNVFIGMGSIILKGVIIGDNSIIGAGSVVTKPIPPNQIWAGNPAKFIRQI